MILTYRQAKTISDRLRDDGFKNCTAALVMAVLNRDEPLEDTALASAILQEGDHVEACGPFTGKKCGMGHAPVECEQVAAEGLAADVNRGERGDA